MMYEVLEANTIPELEEEITFRLKKGWEVCGGIFVFNGTYLQAVIFKSKIKK